MPASPVQCMSSTSGHHNNHDALQEVSRRRIIVCGSTWIDKVPILPDKREWTISSPESLNLETERLSEIARWLDTIPDSNVHSILVARNSSLAFELYRAGNDERWREPLPNANHSTSTKHDLRSVTKVITGLLVGRALQQGLISSLDDPIFKYLPKYAHLCTAGKEHILVRHLLTMSAGLEWNENISAADPLHGEMRLWRSDDMLRTALEPRLEFAPGSVWNYSGGCTELLGSMLQNVSGRPIDEYAEETLFKPLSIRDVEWARHSDGTPSASGGLRMCSRDLAKIGQVMIDKGRWQNKQVVSAAWLEQSLTPQIGADDRLFFYGYHCWLAQSLVHGRVVRWAAGIGLGGQRLIVIPEFDMVVVITAGHYSDGMQAWLPLVILNRYILSAVKNNPA